MAGVLVMCARSKESRAVKEALDILQRVRNGYKKTLMMIINAYIVVWRRIISCSRTKR